ncbi:NAD(P)-binding protein [Cutaneotrichosporon oleaginosum]|uniref:NAD(P)-binding protein n=1 Tax=Cutaneotrichosporon oleaginosum TaxID=879819 RepID=A0A0J0XNV3_9TREE|nr:NAD(P)-binding protein [Cutaneotrichosporon oleaginosum]KLT42768.1 NAD(P)-binding protein [Cutaneotrichosporon oleaginosum]TXT09514.1 hypothetical protein COLE_03448 [Cutaneotrichosporon oleaginosum]
MSHDGLALIQPDAAKRHLEMANLPLLPAAEDAYVVAVRASAACRGELGWENADPHLFTHRPQRVPGPEGAGVVVTAPAGAEFQAGDEIMWALDAWASGSMREYTAVPVGAAARRPKVSWAEAAAIPLSAETAWQGLFEQGGLKAVFDGQANAGKRVLVTGASGSVGLWALRFGSAAGAYMVGVGSGARAGEMRANGAAEVVDYTTTSVGEWARPGQIDLVLDCSGIDQVGAWAALRDGGTFLSVVTDPVETQPEGKKATAQWYLVRTRVPELAQIADLVDERGWLPAIDSVHEFNAFQAAYDRVDGVATGKVVVSISADS